MSSEKLSTEILIVDDQDNWRLALRVLLESEGFQITEADTFQKARDIILSHSGFDLVVLDVRLMDEEIFNVEGLDLLQIINTNTPATKTIILTGYPESVRGEPQADAFIFKVPAGSHFNGREFKQQVSKLLQQ
jgi:DNA-binding NtrC family response regulator